MAVWMDWLMDGHENEHKMFILDFEGQLEDIEFEGPSSDDIFLTFLFYFHRPTLRKLRAEDMFETWVRIIQMFQFERKKERTQYI